MSDGTVDAIINGAASLLCGMITLIGVIISNISAGRKTQARIETAQAVTDTKIDGLTREVREHNNFAKRMPALEERIKEMERRIGELEEIYKK